MSILSIQSHVSYGHVGNCAATFPLQSLGHEVWPVNTVNFSNHTGYGQWKGQALPPQHVGEVIQGIWDLGQVSHCNAVLSGYVGDPAVGDVIMQAVAHVKTNNPQALYLCDPVMGDVGRGFFVQEGVLDFFKSQGLPAAHIITPNHFEASALWGNPIETLAHAHEACAALSAQGPHTVVITSLEVPMAGISPDTITTFLFHNGKTWVGQTPRVPFETPPNGTGDLFSALFLGHMLHTPEPALALRKTLTSVYAVIAHTAAVSTRELQVIHHPYRDGPADERIVVELLHNNIIS